MDVQLSNAQFLPIDKVVTNEGQVDGLPRNPRFIRDDKFEALKRSILENPEMLGYREVLVYPHNGEYIAIGGNMRLTAMRELGFKDVPCKILPESLDAKSLRAITMKDNYGYGEWDSSILADEWDMSELDDWDMSDIVGFDLNESEVEDGVGKMSVKEDGFNGNEDYKVFVEDGDIWEIGRHRLYCGDSTKMESYDIVLNGENAQLSFTSPPYNAGCINIESNERTKKKYETYDDNKSSEEYLDFLSSNLDCLISRSDEVFYNIGLVSGNKKEIFILINKYISLFKDMIYWEKNNSAPMIQEGCINNLVEFIICFGKNNTRKFAHPQFSQGTYWNVIKGRSAGDNEYSKVHKATFPIYLPFEIIQNFSEKDSVIIDSFGGTGTTMMACEQLERKARIIELDPKYCSLSIMRFVKEYPNESIYVNRNGERMALNQILSSKGITL